MFPIFQWSDQKYTLCQCIRKWLFTRKFVDLVKFSRRFANGKKHCIDKTSAHLRMWKDGTNQPQSLWYCN